MFWALSKAKEKIAFVPSCLYICGMLVVAAFALYPVVLPSSVDPAYSLSIYNTAAAPGLTVAMRWWLVGTILALGCFVFIYRLFGGKIRESEA